MSTLVVTHSGSFHTDDVAAYSLIRVVYDRRARVMRTRDKRLFQKGDVVIDVGGIFDPDKRRFDHHQESYKGTLSSAGMVLNWLESIDKLSASDAQRLRDEMFDYIDAIDIGAYNRPKGVPTIGGFVDAFNNLADTDEERLEMFKSASDVMVQVLKGILAGYAQDTAAHAIVKAEMDAAQEDGRRALFFDEYVSWKSAYFALGGETHPTDFIIFPGSDHNWKVVAIPPRLGDFAQKVSLPESWAGLVDDELSAVTGVPGSVFCHKSRFLAVFRTREATEAALRKFHLL
jgi:uncharacterized UPF0160 family protein